MVNFIIKIYLYHEYEHILKHSQGQVQKASRGADLFAVSGEKGGEVGECDAGENSEGQQHAQFVEGVGEVGGDREDREGVEEVEGERGI